MNDLQGEGLVFMGMDSTDQMIADHLRWQQGFVVKSWQRSLSCHAQVAQQ
jgi:hypothetical protein